MEICPKGKICSAFNSLGTGVKDVEMGWLYNTGI
jgi:hypothetical protein